MPHTARWLRRLVHVLAIKRYRRTQTIPIEANALSTKASATLTLNFNSEKQADTILAALSPEANEPPTHRSTVKLQKNGTSLILTAEAEDTVALRATLNAYLHWVQSILNVLDAVKT